MRSGHTYLHFEVDSPVTRGRWFEKHRMHCVVSLSKTLYPQLSTGSIHEDRKCPDMTEEKLTGT